MEEQPGRQGGERLPARGYSIDWIGSSRVEDKPYNMKWNWSPKRFPDPDRHDPDPGRDGHQDGLWESGEAPKTGIHGPEVRKQWYSPRSRGHQERHQVFKQDDPYPAHDQQPGMLPPEDEQDSRRFRPSSAPAR